MKKPKTWSDQTFRALLGSHQPAEPPAGLAETLLKKAARRPAKPAVPLTRRLVLSGGALAAAALIAVLVWPRALPLPLTDGAGTVIARTTSWLNLPGDLRLISQSEELTVAAGSSFEAAPLESPTKTGNTYRLQRGRLQLIHYHSDTTFRLETPLAVIEPAGTSLEVSATPDHLQVTCLAGSLKIRPLNLPPLILPAGQRLDLSAGGQPQVTATQPPVTPALPAAAPPEQTLVPPPALWSWQAPASLTDWTANEDVVVAATEAEVLALSAQSGQTLWTKPLAQAVLALDNSRLAVVSQGKIQLFQAKTGRTVYSLDAPAQAPDLASRPVLADGRLWLGSVDGHLYAWSLDDGKSRARWPLGAGAWGTPLVSGGRVWLSVLDKRFLCLDADSGQLLWTLNLENRLIGDRPQLLGDRIRLRGVTGPTLEFLAQTGKALAVQTTLPPPGLRPDLTAGNRLFTWTGSRLSAHLVPGAKP